MVLLSQSSIAGREFLEPPCPRTELHPHPQPEFLLDYIFFTFSTKTCLSLILLLNYWLSLVNRQHLGRQWWGAKMFSFRVCDWSWSWSNFLQEIALFQNHVLFCISKIWSYVNCIYVLLKMEARARIIFYAYFLSQSVPVRRQQFLL